MLKHLFKYFVHCRYYLFPEQLTSEDSYHWTLLFAVKDEQQHMWIGNSPWVLDSISLLVISSA